MFNFNKTISNILFPNHFTNYFLGALGTAVGSFFGGPIGGAIGGALGSALEGGQAAGKSSSASGKAQQSREDRLAFAKQVYTDYQDKFGETESDIIDSVNNFTKRDNLQKYLTQGTVDTTAAFDKARGMSARRLSRYGLNPGDPRYAQQQQEVDLDQAKTEVGVRNQARTQAEEERIADEDKLFSRRLAVGKFGRTNQPGTSGVLNAYGNAETGYNQDAADYAKQAGQGYGMVGKAIGKGINAYGDSQAADSYSDFSGSTGSSTNEPVWEGSNFISDADTGDLGW